MSETSTEPAMTFSTFVISLASSGLMHLGSEGSTAPVSGPDLHLARQTLELLGVLEQKTKGNLDEEETRLLHAVHEELRQKYERAQGRTG